MSVLCQLNPKRAKANARVAAHTVLGLLNTTQHSMKSLDNSASSSQPTRNSYAPSCGQ